MDYYHLTTLIIPNYVKTDNPQRAQALHFSLGQMTSCDTMIIEHPVLDEAMEDAKMPIEIFEETERIFSWQI
jgi:hypothetical protein